LGRILQYLYKKCEFECESEEKQSGVNRSRFSLSLCFVIPMGSINLTFTKIWRVFGLGRLIQHSRFKSDKKYRFIERERRKTELETSALAFHFLP
jgi:hypothetical protein